MPETEGRDANAFHAFLCKLNFINNPQTKLLQKLKQKMTDNYDKGPDGEELPFIEDIRDEMDELLFPNEEDRDAYYSD